MSRNLESAEPVNPDTVIWTAGLTNCGLNPPYCKYPSLLLGFNQIPSQICEALSLCYKIIESHKLTFPYSCFLLFFPLVQSFSYNFLKNIILPFSLSFFFFETTRLTNPCELPNWLSLPQTLPFCSSDHSVVVDIFSYSQPSCHDTTNFWDPYQLLLSVWASSLALFPIVSSTACLNSSSSGIVGITRAWALGVPWMCSPDL